MQKIKKSLFFILGEIIVVFVLLYSFNNHIGKDKETIKADAVGYYDYLPSIFIHGDFNRHTSNTNDSIYNRINLHSNYLDYHNRKVNKYPVGTAVLESPFFLVALTTSDDVKTGYEPVFHRFIFYSALFYLFLGLIFLKLLLKKYNIKSYVIFICQILITLATSITIYTSFDAGYSHIYSFFAITAFSYFVKSYFSTHQIKYFLWACFFLGLIILIRQINFLVILTLPLLAGSFLELKAGFIALYSKPKKLLLGVLITSLVIMIQVLSWYFQTGYFIVYSYLDEGFNFSSPELSKFLFSYEKGLFVYTPILAICTLSSLYLLITKKYYLFFTWFIFLSVLLYVFSSWWLWYYGCSYGTRPIIDFYVFFFIPFAVVLNQVNWYLKVPIVLLSFSLIPINIIQSYQYRTYIIDWNMLNKENYWKIFLHTEDQYKGYVTERNETTNGLNPLFIHKIENLALKNEKNEISIPMTLNPKDSIKLINKIKVSFNNRFKSNLSSDFIISLNDGQKNLFWQSTYLFHFSKNPDKYQKGTYLFDVGNVETSDSLILNILITKSNEFEILNDFQVTFYGN